MRDRLLPTPKHRKKHETLVKAIVAYGSGWEKHLDAAFVDDIRVIMFAEANPNVTAEYIRLLKNDVKNLRGGK